MEIRAATDADWAQIWPFWRDIVAAGETYAYPEGLTSDEARALWLPGPPDRCIVAVAQDGEVLGSAKFGPNRPGRGSHIGTASFMVAPSARGRGVGRAMGEYVVAALADAGFHGIQFNAVVETNEAALRLWRDLGFETIGMVPEAFDSASAGLVGLHVMYRPLRESR
ncbi:MAG TPA: GNAT family N-acetyltransferase [Dermatophilaceae bacterium]|nr:GNAT family N-acetyltransferase [Dermatophilaceae bacterium]